MGLRRSLVGLAAGVGLLTTACAGSGNVWPFPGGGQYPFDIFPEMHYTQSQRMQEPRRLYPPEGSVPVTGANYVPDATTAERLTNPVQASPDNLAKANALFARNCQVCHGPQGKGDGPAAAFFKAYNGKQPADLTAAAVSSRTDGALYYFISDGLNYNPGGDVNGMPAFRNLLTEQERWTVLLHVRQLEGK